MFTAEQRAWVTDFAASPASNKDDLTMTTGAPAAVIERLLGILLPNLGDVTDMMSTCILDNKPPKRLALVNKSLHLDHGTFTRNPDIVIEPGEQANGSVKNTKAPGWIPFIGEMSADGPKKSEQGRFFTEKDVTLRVTPPRSKPSMAVATIPAGAPIGKIGQDALHTVSVEKFTATYPSVPAGRPGTDYLVETYLEQAHGGDQWSGHPVPA